MTKFRPCIDLHDGKVKQIVGGSLTEGGQGPEENFVSDRPSTYFAELYAADALEGGHVIQLGPGNREAAMAALSAYPGGLQVGGGVTPENAGEFLAAGASHVIVTSALFSVEGRFLDSQLDAFVRECGADRLVVDLSCRGVSGGGWVVAMNRWQTLTDLPIETASLERFVGRCAELLIHAADVEGKCQGIDESLVQFLGDWAKIPMTYAGGARSVEDLALVDRLSGGSVDLTIGSALDIFGGDGARYADCVAWNRRRLA